MANFLVGIISLSIGVVLLSSVFISTVKAANQSYSCPGANSSTDGVCTWSTAETALWGLLTIVGIAGLVYGMLSVFGLA